MFLFFLFFFVWFLMDMSSMEEDKVVYDTAQVVGDNVT
jgi:hypothetical protein